MLNQNSITLNKNNQSIVAYEERKRISVPKKVPFYIHYASFFRSVWEREHLIAFQLIPRLIIYLLKFNKMLSTALTKVKPKIIFNIDLSSKFI